MKQLVSTSPQNSIFNNPRQTIDKNFDQIIKKQNELFTKTNNIETIMYLPDLIIEQNLPKISNPSSQIYTTI